MEAIPQFDRLENSVELPLPGIRNLHSFTSYRGGILASQLSCHRCRVSSLCEECKKIDLTISAEDVEAATLETEEGENAEDDNEEDLEVEDPESDSEDDAGSAGGESDSESEEVSDEEASITDPGSVVWALWGRKRYPAKVVLAAELPDLVRASLRKDDGKSAVVMFYGDNDYS